MRKRLWAGCAVAASLLAGCGGSSNLNGGGSTVAQTVQRLAGDYSVVLQPDQAIYDIHVSGGSNALSGSGTTRSPRAYTYNGSLANDGTLNVTITLTADGSHYTVTGAIAQNSFADTTATGTWRDSTGLTGVATISRLKASPVTGGPVNSLVDSISLPTGIAGPVRGAALSPDGSILYAFAGGSVLFLRTSDRSLIRSVAIADSPLRMAVSADGSVLYAAGFGLTAIDTSSGAFTTVPVVGPVKWITTPTLVSTGTRAYFGTGDGRGHVVVTKPRIAVTDLPSLGTGNNYDDASVTADGSRLLISAGNGAAAVDTINNVVTAPRFAYTILTGPPTPVVASSTGSTLFAVASSSQPQRIHAVDLAARGVSGSGNIGSAATRISDLALSPDGSKLIATASDSGRVFILNASTLSLTQAIDVTIAPDPNAGSASLQPQVTISPDGTRAYVTGQDAIAVIRLQ